jgi:hypothetical protein
MPTRQSSSAERVKRLQAQAARRERNRRLAIAGTAIAVVVIIVVVLVVAKLVGGGGSKDQAAPPQTGLPAVVSAITSVPPATLDAVGVGTAGGLQGLKDSTPLTDSGKTEMLYVGGEFCPYCAATRWGMAAALSRFGTFKGLGLMSSETNDIYPDTATITFEGSTYTSTYLVFHPYETLDRNKQPLDTLSPADQAIFAKYDNTPYTSSAGGIPFVDIGGKYFLYGSAYDPGILKGLTQAQIAADLTDTSSPVAQAIDGEANVMAAAICLTNNEQPSSVCSSAGVKTAAAKLTSSG